MEKALAKVRVVYGDNLKSICRYRRYDETLWIIVLGKSDLRASYMLRKIYRRHPFIVFLEHDLTGGEDVFPLEYLHMKTHTELIEGNDYFQDLVLQKKDLRTQLEYEIRNKLIYLRQECVQAKNPKQLLKKIIPQFVVFLETLFFLQDEIPQRKIIQDIKKIETLYGISFKEVIKIVVEQEDGVRLSKSEIPDKIQLVHDELETLLHTVNQM